MSQLSLLSGSLNPSLSDYNRLVNAINAVDREALTVSASALTGTTLAANVIHSSLTSLGTLTSLAVTGAVSAASFAGAGTGLTGSAAALSIGGNAATATTSGSVTGLSVTGGKTLTASNTITLTGTDNVTMNVTNSKVRTIGFSVSSASLTTGQQGGFVVVPVAGTITGWSICANAGTATVAVWKIASGTAVPTVANLINTLGISLASGTAIESTTVSDFTSTTVTAGDIFAFNLSAVSGVTTLQFQLQITVA